MELLYVIDKYKDIFPLKNGTSSTNILYTGSNKIFPIHYGLWGVL